MRIKFATTRLQAFFADADVGDDDEYHCEDGNAGADGGDVDEYCKDGDAGGDGDEYHGDDD